MKFHSTRAILLATTIATMPQMAMAQQGVDDTDSRFSEIVVSAQRTDQRLQDVPVSVTAITAEEIEVRQISE